MNHIIISTFCIKFNWYIQYTGGKVGAEALRDCEPLVNKLRNQLQSDSKYVGAICAAPGIIIF